MTEKLEEVTSQQRHNNQALTTEDHYQQLRNIMIQGAAHIIAKYPYLKMYNNKLRIHNDQTLDCSQDSLTLAQKELKRKIYHSRSCEEDRARYMKERAKVLSQIKQRVRRMQKQHMQEMVNDMQAAKGMAKQYEIQRKLKITTYKQFRIYIPEEQIYSSSMLGVGTIIKDFYEKFFNSEGKGQDSFEPWSGTPRCLQKLITAEEVMKSMGKLRNDRATGQDLITAEMIKYGGIPVATAIASIFNQIFKEHQPCEALTNGILIPLNKPGKPLTVENTRPITLLNTMRKLLSLIVLNRIYPSIMKYIPEGQRGFMRKRSTADIIWTYKTLHALANRRNKEYYILGIDMTKAFDSIDRSILLNCLQGIIKEDEYRIIKYLLNNTYLQIKIGAEFGPKFHTMNGTPQGDALSPILFAIYLENALRKFRETYPMCYNDPEHEMPYQFFKEIAYADDVDFISDNIIYRALAETGLPEILQTVNLVMQGNKTEHITIQAGKEMPRVRKLGIYLNNSQDVTNKINKARQAFRALWKIWRYAGSQQLKVKMIQTCILPILTYNLAGTDYRKAQIQKLEATHRRFLRMALKIFYPKIISNEELYTLTKTEPISLIITKLRWRYLRTVLNDSDAAIHKDMMIRYFQSKDQYSNQLSKRKGREPTNIINILQNDLRKIDLQMRNISELRKIEQESRDFDQWVRHESNLLKILVQQEEESQRKTKERRQASKRRREDHEEEPQQQNRGRRIRFIIGNNDAEFATFGRPTSHPNQPPEEAENNSLVLRIAINRINEERDLLETRMEIVEEMDATHG
jgi:hypothetical protein